MGFFKKKTPQASERKNVEQIIRLCPRCKKPMPRSAYNVSGWFAPKEYTCDHCGYTGHFFIEVDPSEVDLQKLDEITEGKRPLDEIVPEDEDTDEDDDLLDE
jgi:hypothetical protein